MLKDRLGLLLLILAPAALAAATLQQTDTHSPTFSAHRIGDVVRLDLAAHLGISWRRAGVERISVLTNLGQRRLDRTPLPRRGRLALQVPPGHCSMILVEAGARGPHAGSWRSATHHSKTISCPRTGVSDRDREVRRQATGLITAKVGSRLEIRPLLNPTALLPGSDFPVRLYFEGVSASNTGLLAVEPSGELQETTTDSSGIATLRLSSSGRWLLRFEHGKLTGELTFDVPAAGS